MKLEGKIPNEEKLLESLSKIAFTLDKAYLGRMDNSMPLPYEKFSELQPVSDKENIRLLRVSRWIYDKSEKISDCFQNVLSVFADTENSLALVIHRTSVETEMYFVTQNVGKGRNEDSKNDIELLESSLRGNFPGSEICAVKPAETEKTLDRLLDFKDGEHNGYSSIAALTNIPSEKTEDYISQGIEKLLNGVVPKKDSDGKENDDYIVVILAKALDPDAVRTILSGYQELATALAPYAGYQFQAGENEATSDSEMHSLSHTESISNSITKTHAVNVSGSLNKAVSITNGFTLGIGNPLPIIRKLIPNIGFRCDKTENQGGSVSAGYGYSVAKSKQEGHSDTETNGTTHTLSIGSSENTTYTYKSYMVSDLIERLELTIKRIRESQAVGLWSSGVYVLAHSVKQSKNVANFLRALSQGDESFVQHAFIQEWPYQGDGEELTAFGEAKKYIRSFQHPVFVYSDSGENAIMVTPTADVSTPELAKVFAFPRDSVQGLPVIKCARFGREPHPMYEPQETVNLGCTYHMRTPESGRVLLDRTALTAHTFVTGSTGAGKSNAIYTILSRLCPEKVPQKSGCDVHFLVIEPAKGEYKEALGGRKDVTVYGTNPKKSKLLRLNPFSFPADTHVLEHIDRLVEIFNACWPMYAAMPAVLKASVEQAYLNCGWSLNTSTYARTGSSKQSARRFPTFADVMKTLPTVVDNKGFSGDTQGDYKGALLTRLESLTNGINGQVLCSENELLDEALFDANTIIDLSRVGSPETKALLMGILILKLQEHRMAQRDVTHSEANEPLTHITVLEEAHNLLRRTSVQQSQEGANLQGKAVEMLTNAIAEMRTYGEGFIIADQAPGMLDTAVIRNTNTKIILRLPYEIDRQLVGKAAGLNNDQIDELSRLDVGVAAVFQNHWIEPVLCKVDRFEAKRKYKPEQETPILCEEAEKLFKTILRMEQTDLSQEDVDAIKNWIERHAEAGPVADILRKALEKTEAKPTEANLKRAIYCMVKGKMLFGRAEDIPDALAACRTVDQQIQDMFLVSHGVAEHLRCEAASYSPELERYTKVR